MTNDAAGSALCGASITYRGVPHETYVCQLERDHAGAHTDKTASWTSPEQVPQFPEGDLPEEPLHG